MGKIVGAIFRVKFARMEKVRSPFDTHKSTEKQRKKR